MSDAASEPATRLPAQGEVAAPCPGLSGKLPPFATAWSLDIIFTVLGAYFLWRLE